MPVAFMYGLAAFPQFSRDQRKTRDTHAVLFGKTSQDFHTECRGPSAATTLSRNAVVLDPPRKQAVD